MNRFSISLWSAAANGRRGWASQRAEKRIGRRVQATKRETHWPGNLRADSLRARLGFIRIILPRTLGPLKSTPEGHGWFVDPTPTDSSDFRTGSRTELIPFYANQAYGKVDLLTV